MKERVFNMNYFIVVLERFIVSIDSSIFLFINTLPHTWLTDTLALSLSGYGNRIVLILFASVLFLKEEQNDHWFIVRFGLAGGIAWFMQSMLKDVFLRIRPHEIVGMIVVGEQLLDYSFPSGHAMIAFALTSILVDKEPKYRWVIYGIAILIAISRVFLGVHFPSDVIVGGILGLGIGQLILRILGTKRYNTHYDHTKRKRAANYKRQSH